MLGCRLMTDAELLYRYQNTDATMAALGREIGVSGQTIANRLAKARRAQERASAQGTIEGLPDKAYHALLAFGFRPSATRADVAQKLGEVRLSATKLQRNFGKSSLRIIQDWLAEGDPSSAEIEKKLRAGLELTATERDWLLKTLANLGVIPRRS